MMFLYPDTIIDQVMIEYKEFRKIYFQHYRKKYSKYIPYKKILRKIDKNWQIYRYNNSIDTEVCHKIIKQNKKFRWNYVLEEVKYY